MSLAVLAGRELAVCPIALRGFVRSVNWGRGQNFPQLSVGTDCGVGNTCAMLQTGGGYQPWRPAPPGGRCIMHSPVGRQPEDIVAQTRVRRR